MTTGITPAGKPGAKRFLSDVLVEMGLLNAHDVEAADQNARHHSKPLEAVLLESGQLTADHLSRAIAELHGMDHVELENFAVDPDVAALIGRSAAERYRAVPIAVDASGALLVAIADPVDAIGLSDIGVITRSEIRPVVASEPAINALISGLPEGGTAEPPAVASVEAGAPEVVASDAASEPESAFASDREVAVDREVATGPVPAPPPEPAPVAERQPDPVFVLPPVPSPDPEPPPAPDSSDRPAPSMAADKEYSERIRSLLASAGEELKAEHARAQNAEKAARQIKADYERQDAEREAEAQRADAEREAEVERADAAHKAELERLHADREAGADGFRQQRERWERERREWQVERERSAQAERRMGAELSAAREMIRVLETRFSQLTQAATGVREAVEQIAALSAKPLDIGVDSIPYDDAARASEPIRPA